MRTESAAILESNAGSQGYRSRLAAISYLATGAAVWLACQLVALSSWASQSGIRGRLYDWTYVHALPVGWILEALPPSLTRSLGRPGARVFQLACFCVVSLVLWLLGDSLPFQRRLRPWLKPIYAWFVFEIVYVLIFTGLAHLGLIAD